MRCIRRIGRRGLASAVIEGALASSARYVAVIDGDLQHDETRLPQMLAAARAGADLVVASRHVAGGDDAGLGSRWRHLLSDSGICLVHRVLPVHLTDPMSGFFMLPREMFERLAPRLTGQGFKILLDIVLSAPRRLAGHRSPQPLPRARHRRKQARRPGAGAVRRIAARQAAAWAGAAALHRPSPRWARWACWFIWRCWRLALKLGSVPFAAAQAIATVAAMGFNFELNNQITYRDQRLRGPALWRGLLLFMLVCGLGAAANIGIARALYDEHTAWTLAGATGAVIGVVWNYAVSATLVWRAR